MSHRTHNRPTAEWQRLDIAHHLHPFTDYKVLSKKGSRIITRAEGVYVWDSEGNKILDGMAGLWCVNLGYGRRELVEAGCRQLESLPFYNNFFQTTHPPAVDLATLLAEVAPKHLNHTFFTNSGSEANDTVVRLARHYWALKGKPWRQVIISRENAYHGSTVAGASLGGMKPMHAQGGLPIPGIAHIEQPYWYKHGGTLTPEEFGLKAARALEKKIAELGPDNVAAFIAEPVQGAGGVIVPPDSYWPEISRICNKHDILLVVDEVICGFGRTGKWFGSNYFGLEPDLMPVAKGLSSGYLPIGGVMVSDRVVDVLEDKGGEFFHGYTYSGHPVAAAVAAENIRILRDEGVVERVDNKTAPYFQKRLRELADHPLVGDIRGIGLLGGIELVSNKQTRKGFENAGSVGLRCREHCFDNGLVMRSVGETMILSPPLIISP
ncbi:MAG TPA: aspartate aminotransferase family protein, partial [Gammaproteobacteria bacterium]